ncbi:hypothetical protein BCR42DRAFT_418351 [Absidia repens]|uniref:Phosphodiesterase n=1 Tax=Absidia repens TaxID=90262 RepID=A0A1X2ID60_9FUNG|nr:hypothetical protein BCR42DRAFT_418351 [Absidia repens]
MNAQQFSVLVVTDSENTDASLSLLGAVFSYVTFIRPHRNIVGVLQAHNQNKMDGLSTLLILDDHAFTEDALYDILESIKFAVEGATLRHVSPIVYSSSNSKDYMLQCMDHGAIDYVLKPLREDIVNTLFLNVIRSSVQQHRLDQRQSSVSTISKNSNNSNNSVDNQGIMWKAFQRRLQSVFEVNHNLIHQSVKEYFLPDGTISRSGLNSLSSDTKARLKARLCSWNFEPFDLTQYELIQCVFIVLKHILDLPDLKHISMSDDELYDFLFDVANMYQSLNPYHNFLHAVDVMQATYYFLCQISVITPMDPHSSPSLSPKPSRGRYIWLGDHVSMSDLFSSFDVLALILASIGHDVGHPGVNNMFMIRTATPLALMYNDRSVLESFHAMAFFNILQRHCFQPFTEWQTTAEYTRFRKIVVRSILATDMGLHDDYVNKIRGQRERLNVRPVDITNQEQVEDEIILICGSLIKCADISNCARPFPVAKKWAEILQKEFHEQGDLEKELELTVLPINDRGKISLEDFQLGFKKSVAGKLFEAVASILPDMDYAVKTIQNNCMIWESRKQQKSLNSEDEDKATPSTASNGYELTDIVAQKSRSPDRSSVSESSDQSRPNPSAHSHTYKHQEEQQQQWKSQQEQEQEYPLPSSTQPDVNETIQSSDQVQQQQQQQQQQHQSNSPTERRGIKYSLCQCTIQ